jgi:RNA polymerase sigma-70 factor (ECF subfamily)
MKDVRLVKKAKKGDKEALISLIMNNKTEYYKLAYTYMKNEDDSLDVMQELIVILYEKIHTLKKEESFGSWSKTILVNLCKKMLVMNKKTISIETLREQKEESYYMDSVAEDRILLEKHLSHLKPIHEEVIKLKYEMDYDYETIATLLKIPLGTVKSRMNTAMKNLRESLEGEKTYEEFR